MQQFQPYLWFGGRCAEAMRFYERVLGGKIERMITYGEAPPDASQGEACSGQAMPPEAATLIMHASLSFEGSVLMASDAFPGMPYEGMKGVGISINLTDTARAREVFNALAEGGKVSMPLGETFWVELFGSVTDRFGTDWLINGGQPKM